MNEWRQEENKPAVEGGDTVLVSANLKSIEEHTKQPEPEPAPTEPAPATDEPDTNQSGTTEEPDENGDNNNGEE